MSRLILGKVEAPEELLAHWRRMDVRVCSVVKHTDSELPAPPFAGAYCSDRLEVFLNATPAPGATFQVKGLNMHWKVTEAEHIKSVWSDYAGLKDAQLDYLLAVLQRGDKGNMRQGAELVTCRGGWRVATTLTGDRTVPTLTRYATKEVIKDALEAMTRFNGLLLMLHMSGAA